MRQCLGYLSTALVTPPENSPANRKGSAPRRMSCTDRKGCPRTALKCLLSMDPATIVERGMTSQELLLLPRPRKITVREGALKLLEE